MVDCWERTSVQGTGSGETVKTECRQLSGVAHANDYGLQIVKLIENAHSVDAAALYLFYASSLVHLPHYKVAINGMFVAEADDIDTQFVSVARQYVSDADILLRSIPLSLIFCLTGALK